MKKHALFFLLFFCTNILFSQQKDSLNVQYNRVEFKYKKMVIPVGLMITGVIASGHGKNSWNNQIAAERNKNYKNFRNQGDDYLQLSLIHI